MTNLQRIDSASFYCCKCLADVPHEVIEYLRKLARDQNLTYVFVVCPECVEKDAKGGD